MTQKILCAAPILNVPISILENDINHRNDKKQHRHLKETKDNNQDDELIFGALDDEDSSKNEKSPSTDEGIHLHSSIERTQKKRERAHSSISTVDDDWENMLPITEGGGPVTSNTSLQSINEKSSKEQIIGMSNFRAKHRLRRRSKTNSLVRWKEAVKKVVQLKDPWLDFMVDQHPEEHVTRHEFDPIKRTWHMSQIIIKIESKAFAHGSMRECFRLKKLSIFSTHQDWDHSSNYISKRYIEDVPIARYFDDVMMQMTTKLWATHYNEHNPPKKVDIVQMSVLEFKDRVGQPYYHLERFIDGDYIKYNSNSGFVCDDTLRHTPQAFSHFTFEASCHEQIVVDIQGVGDLYTDPQIHTSLGFEYGEGNLGIRGMALFFSTHECNPICSRLNLTSFDLTDSEREHILQQHSLSPSYNLNLCAQTTCRGSEEPLNGLSKFGSLLRKLRSQSSISEDESDGYVSEASSLTATTAQLLDHNLSLPKHGQYMTTFSEENIPLVSSTTKLKMPILSTSINMMPASSPNYYARSHSELTFNIEDIYNAQTPNNYANNHRPSSVILEKANLGKFHEMSACYEKYESILGQIHLEMCKYYQVGRFSELGSEEFDEASAFFHLELSAELCVKEGIFVLAKIYLDFPRDLLSHYHPSESTNLFQKGLDMMIRASEYQETEANLYLAQLYDKGVNGSLEPDWKKAAEYYEKYIDIREKESNNIDEDSGINESNQIKSANNGVPFHDQYDIVAQLATIYKTGGNNLLCNYQKSGDLFNKAAEMAMTAMKGRLANKYYSAAEEAYALEPDEENENS
ncbi:unnamed protein product [Adineta steineri]|uniref:Alpha-type protein kinase domain-containing protein n=1 Tax=Adineta steineri TaxID=433720 RepID=A0A814AAJ1_9BILA|nr:unnamed protein product [Adineta steineri]CAF3760348.1 unnamed protein product [Adineta steineri]